jgi:cell division initiation protein
MRMTPLDIQSHTFRRRRFRGVDSNEVEGFLRMAAEDYETLVRENEGHKQRIRQLEERIEDLASQEKLLRDTLVSAQAMSEGIQRSAVKEAEVLMSEAEVRAEKILDASHRRAARLAEDIREMHGARTRLAAGLRACTQMHLAMIDRIEQDPDEEPLTANVSYLARSANSQGRDA